MKLVRYNQSGADFYGAEGEIYFKPTPRYRIGLSGDYVRGRLKNLPSLPGREDAYGNRPLIAQADQNAPRVPAARLGFHLNAALTDRIDAHLDYYRVFAQNKLARYETPHARTPYAQPRRKLPPQYALWRVELVRQSRQPAQPIRLRPQQLPL